ncbi:MAG: carboxypeptidase regulatory-like domain-containing protein [Planctomycetales bacterium]|nr:carboxypeptidase regulatory-like domain-containing protein [bacterium]UNM08714.1 MAG: carboxypeptidase regulatory-like domain-containing protein [Planctomycetales bacterium]
MKTVKIVWVALAAIAALLSSCGGSGGPATPPDSFERMTAVAYGNNGTPLSNMQVRVEGVDTGISTDANGNFTLQRGQFPRGVNAENEISLGTNGVVIGSRSVVPLDNQNLVIRFDPTVNEGTGSLGGTVTDDKSGAGLNGVEVTIFSEAGGVQTTHSSGGVYSFSNVAAGTWNIVANTEDYYPGMAMVRIAEGDTSVRNIELTRKGQVGSGEGITVTGRVVDQKTGAGVADATVSMMVDTGYFGIPEPMPMPFEDDIKWDDVDTGVVDSGQSDPGFGGGGSDGREAMTSAPYEDYWRYEPQYQEVTTDADGNFEFPDGVAGYSAWISVYKDGYLNASLSEDIYNRTSDLDLEIEIQPIVYTDISGVVVDGDGNPIKGAYVEYVFGGGFGGGIAVPGAVDLDMMFEDGVEIFNEFGAPAPPQTRGEDFSTGGSDDGFMAPAADFAEGSTNSDGNSQNSSEFDNNMLQRFLWEQRNGRSSSMVAPDFIGYYSGWADDNGEFSFEDVPAGPYYVFASAYRHISYSADVTVEEEAAANEVTITLPEVPVGSVEGRVTDEDGNPIPDALVNATQPNVDPFTYTNSNGEFVIDNVPTGEWLVSGYRNGHLTQGIMVEIRDGQASNVNLVLETYEAPDVNTGNKSGTVYDGFDDSTIAGADMVFTPTDEQLGGGYFSHVLSDSNGRYSTTLAEVEYNLLIQKGGYEDIFIRIWPDMYDKEMDFWMWPIGAPGGSGGGGGPIFIEPGFPVDDDGGTTTDPAPPIGL